MTSQMVLLFVTFKSDYRREMLRLVLKENSLQLSVESPTYKPTVPRWAQRQQVPLPTFSWYILRQKLTLSKTVFKPTVWKHYRGKATFFSL